MEAETLVRLKKPKTTKTKQVSAKRQNRIKI